MRDQEITHKDESGAESFKFTQRGYMWLNPETLEWNYCNPAFSMRSVADLKRIVELESKNAKMLECLCDISNACIAQMAMSYNLDAEDIGQSIYAATGMTNPQINAALKEPKL